MKPQKVCVLVSGGLDSSILLLMMARHYREVFPLYVQCGLIWEKAELYWLKKFLRKIQFSNVKPLQILDLPVRELYMKHWSITGRKTPDLESDDRQVYLPGRNLLLLSEASLFCALNKIGILALGILKGNPFQDSQRAFFRAFDKLVKMGLSHSLKIVTPFSKVTKAEVLKIGKGLPFHLTFSCLRPNGIRSCGRCNKCAERKKVVKAM